MPAERAETLRGTEKGNNWWLHDAASRAACMIFIKILRWVSTTTAPQRGRESPLLTITCSYCCVFTFSLTQRWQSAKQSKDFFKYHKKYSEQCFSVSLWGRGMAGGSLSQPTRNYHRLQGNGLFSQSQGKSRRAYVWEAVIKRLYWQSGISTQT